ncbi:hypothetical protein [Marinobacter sp. F4206]|uniref:hypothetical protein n=1 Tax=Marinobacter sp. F4206 TaxID=2861777 RepID=UPI001C5CFA64|nr:hypothetical protein [Marinobacter sp. F4206]MBW4933142.1 hypothetical protein [Marinobacter sp. F4206]
MTVDTSTSSNHPPTRSEPSADRPTGKDKWHKPKISLPETSYEKQRVFKTYPYVTMPLNGYFKFLASHEFAMLKRAESFPFTPSSVELPSDRRTISYQHLQGKTIKQLNAEGEIPEGFSTISTSAQKSYTVINWSIWIWATAATLLP